jgi:hypothetical protein
LHGMAIPQRPFADGGRHLTICEAQRHPCPIRVDL